MNYNNNIGVFENGAVWLRADFHLHTEADKEFKYSGNKADFCSLYVEQLKKQKIGIGVITNHNKFDKEEFKELNKKALTKGIWLLPGVEFSLKDGIHIVIVFEEVWYRGQEKDDINKFLENAFYSIANSKNPPYPNSMFDLKETVEKLDKLKHNYFIVLAHVDSDNGLFKKLKGDSLSQFIKQKCFNKVLAVQKSENNSKYEELCDKSKRQIACVEGSDNARAGIEGLGSGRKTYLKIGDFNFKALQYALENPECRVKPEEPPVVENSYIKSIDFKGELLDSKISFSSELNSLVGIRGSGKSAILEILRYALDIPLDDKAMDKKYKEGLVKYVLGSGGKVIIEVMNRQKEIYRIKHIYGQEKDIYKYDNLQKGITLDAIFERRPVYFGQKDLSDKDVDFGSNLIKKIVGGHLNDVRRKIEDNKREIKKITAELKLLEDLSEIKKETENERDNAEHKLRMFREKGVENKLKLQTNFEMDITKIQSFKKSIENYIGELSNLIENNRFLIKQGILSFDSDVNKPFFEEIDKQSEGLKQEFSNLEMILKRSKVISGNLENILNRLVSKQDELKEEFAKIRRESGIEGFNPDDYIKIKKEFEISKIKLVNIDKSEAKRKELLDRLEKFSMQLNDLWYKEFKILQSEAHKITNGRTKLSIKIKHKENKDKFLFELQSAFRGSGIREAAFRNISGKYVDFIDIWKDKFQKFKDIISEDQQSYFKKCFESDLYNFLTFRVEDEIIINFEGKPLRDHSLGRRASALILFLLAQKENDILIIDQPEDDLDNQTIYEDIVKEIRKLKGNMQFIFVTHNANIPVLGDSEMVIACECADDRKIKVETGSIDKTCIQEKIIKIMEGGEEAFRNRRKTYDVWDKIK